MEMLEVIQQGKAGYLSAASWFFSSDIRPTCGLASNRRLLMYGLYSSALNRRRALFMVTTEAEALAGLRRHCPGMLIVTPKLDQGDGLALVTASRKLVPDLRTVLLCNLLYDDLVAAGNSDADAVFCEEELATEVQPISRLTIALSLGRRYRSPRVQAAMLEAEQQAAAWREAPPALTSREQELIELWVEGLGDREVAERLGLSYATVRSYGRDLRKKLGVGSRSQMVLKVVSMGLGRFSGG